MIPQLPAPTQPRRQIIRAALPLRLPSGPAICLPAPAQPPASLFSYDNVAWQRVAPAPRRAGLLAVERLMDQLAMFLNGELSETAFDAATRSFRTTIFKAAPTPLMQPSQPKPPVRSQLIQTPAGQRLGELLGLWLDVQAAPILEVHEQAGFRYQLYRWADRDGILIQRRAPDGRRLLDGRIAGSRQEAQAVIAELACEYQRQSLPIQQRTVITRPAAMDGSRQLEALLERGPIPDPFQSKSDEIDELNKAAFDNGRRKAQESLKAYQDMMAARQNRMH